MITLNVGADFGVWRSVNSLIFGCEKVWHLTQRERERERVFWKSHYLMWELKEEP